jgi:phosphoribosylanthranilate isomerase
MIIQIYAFTDPKTAVKAANMGVNHIGFVAGKYDEVPAELTFKEAREIVNALPPQATPVALTMAVDLDEIVRMVEAVRPHIVHVSSDIDLVNIEMMRDLHERLAGQARLMKAIPVENESSIGLAQEYAAVSDLLLLDTKHADFPGVGATGLTHDWSVSRRIVESVGIPVIMAGGLTPANVGAAMREIKPWAVDSNTSTNAEGSNVIKDLARIRAFVDAVHAAEEVEG